MPLEELISGRQSGVAAACLRTLLGAASHGYALGVGVRNRWYDTGRPVRRLPVPVISVGNITVGGTGKTPMALWLCEHLLRAGRRPAVVSRGYRSSATGFSDESAMLARRCPQAVVVAAGPDRCEGGRTAIRQHGADIIVLDDGFQHRRLGRDLDVVLIDATCPFGYGRLLPRGLLREPPASLTRADVLVVTRADQVSEPELQGLRKRLARLAAGRPVLRAVHRATGFVALDGSLMEASAVPRRPVLVAAIARPAAFERTVRDMGYVPAATCWYPDHHAYTAADAVALCDRVRRNAADALLATEKDAVKLAALRFDWPCPVLALRVDIAFLDDDATIMADLVHRAVAGA